MTTVAASNRPTRSIANGEPARRLSLADVTNKGSGLPNRYIIHGCEGTGKTSFAAQCPAPIFIQTRGETGLETLIDSNRVLETPHFPECQSWQELLDGIDSLTTSEHSYKTLVIDTANGAERLCHEEVCKRDFGNDWGKHGFVNYQQGYDTALADWRKMLIALDRVREVKRMSIVLLCHTKVKTFKNPVGADYDRYQPDMHDKTWGLSHKWADAVLFLNFETFVNEKDPKKKGKAQNSQARIMYTERHAAFDAKNRMGLTSEIDMGSSAVEAWGNFKAALVAGIASGKAGVE